MRQRLLEKQAFITAAIVLILVFNSSAPVFSADSSETTRNIQQSRPLTQNQIEELIRNLTPDSAIAIEIQRRGIDFRPDSKLVDNLRRLGAGPKTLDSLNTKLNNSSGKSYLCPSSSGKIVVLVANFQSLGEKQSDAVTELILDQLREATREYSDIEIVALNEWISPQQGRDTALARGRVKNAAVVLWGWYKKTRDKVILTAHFDPVQSIPKLTLSGQQQTHVFASPDIESFTIQMKLSKELTYLTLLTIGLARLEADDFEGAINRLTKALQHGVTPEQIVSPSFLYFLRGKAYFLKATMGPDTSKALESAITDLSKAIELDPAPGPYLLLGFAYLQNAHPDKAVVAAEKASELKPDKLQEATALLLMVLVNRLRGSNDKAETYAARAIKILESLPESEETLFLFSQVYFSSNDVIRATISLDQASKLATCDAAKVVYSYLRALIYGSSRNFDKAIAELDYVIRIRPAWSDAYLMRGAVHAEKKRYDLAIEDYGRAIVFNPNSPLIYDARGDAHDERGELDEAIADYKEAVRIDPRFSQAHYKLALAYRQREQSNEAIASYDLYLKLEPKDVTAYRNRAWLYEEKGEYDLAIADVGEMIKLEPDDSDRYKWRARLYKVKGSLDQAIEDYSRYIGSNPSDASGYILRGSVYVQNKQLDKAIADFTAAIAMKPTDPSGYDGRATAYGDAGKDELAVADLKMVIQLAPEPWRKKIAENDLKIISLRRERKVLELEMERKSLEMERKSLETKTKPPNPR